jgi:MFS transporter, CP family, cyanate transporter
MSRRAAPRIWTSPSSPFCVAVLWLAGVDLRLTVLAVPPVLPLIHHAFALSERAIGALSGLPVLLFGLGAVPGSLLIARLGANRAAITGLLVIAAAGAARGLGPSVAMLFAMTFVMAAGVAIVQSALPSLVAYWFPSQPRFATAVYANGLLIGEILPVVMTIPLILPLTRGSWPASFVVWSAPVAVTALLVARCPKPEAAALISARTTTRWWPDWGSRRTWQLGLMLGGTGGCYFAANALIPDYLHAVGRPDLVTAGLGALNLGQLPASLLLLLAARSIAGRKAVFAGMQFIGLLGITILTTATPWLTVLGAGLIGFCCAFSLIVTLALPPQLVAANVVHRLSAGMFAIGYTFSCLIPLAGGAIWDDSRLPAAGFAAPAASVVIVLAAAVTFRFP